MKPRIAMVHDWLIHMRGGEKVLESLAEVFPEADIFTLFCRPERLSPMLRRARIRTSFLQLIPGIAHFYRWLFPLMPLAVSTLDLSGYDLVISSSHCVAKGCRVSEGALHICYCHSPVRYVWGFRNEYFGSFPAPIRRWVEFILDRFKGWDLRTNEGVHFFIANSENTAKRIEKFYSRSSSVIYPPVDVSFLSSESCGGAESEQKDYFLVVSAMVPYKRVDLAIEAFNRLGYPLLVVGEGPELARLRNMAKPNVRFQGALGAHALRQCYHACRALIFPGEEDFGIVPVEAQACGKPVIAYAKGGVLETVTRGTGVFFSEQTVESLMEAVRRFGSRSLSPELIKEHARNFDRSVFQDRVRSFVLTHYDEWKKRNPVDNVPSCATK